MKQSKSKPGIVARKVSEGDHQPVLLKEVLQHLNLKDDSNVVDATLGLGGHAAAVLAVTKTGKLCGLDRDALSLERARDRLASFGDRVTVRQGNYAELDQLIPADFGPVDAILLDLGISSWQLAERGFSFQHDAPLDFRMDVRQPVTAAQLVAELPERELADLIYRYGEEHRSRPIAKAIVTARRQGSITTTEQLADVISGSIRRSGRLHPATKTFQALRIAVNDELESLKQGLAAAEAVLAPDGRLAVITFHSLEDRIVKDYLKNSERLKRVNKKVIQPQYAEIRANPRARSAKLRVAEKIVS